MRKHLSGTSDTSHLSDPSQDRGCPCGRTHDDTGSAARERKQMVFNHRSAGEAAAKAAEADKLLLVDGRTILQFAGDCERPIEIDGVARKFGTDGRNMTYQVRCRKCPACLRAKMRYWIAAGVHQTRITADQGRRTWFGTLTLSAQSQTDLLATAQEEWAQELATSSALPDWWEDPHCDYRFALVRAILVRELQKYWKRLRKAGHKFTYFVAIERHKSGLPHVHWLLHEGAEPIRKRHLKEQWPFGYAKVKLVGGNSANAPAPEGVAAYVAKYLQKSAQARQIASRGYKPAPKRSSRSRERSERERPL